jgi:hypothetical protein
MEHPPIAAAVGKSVRMSNLRILPESSRIARNLQHLISINQIRFSYQIG